MNTLMKRIAAFCKSTYKNVSEISYLTGKIIINKSKELFAYTKQTVKEAFRKNFNRTKIMTESATDEITKEMGESLKSIVSLKNVVKNLFSATAKEFRISFTGGFRYLFRTGFEILKSGKRYYRSFFNIAAPILSLAVLLITVNVLMGLNFGVSVSINGEEVARVKNEAVYESAEKMVQERIVYQSDEDAVAFNPTFKLAVMSQDDMVDDIDLTDRLIRCSSSEITEAYGLYVDDSFEGAVMDTGAVDEAISAKLNAYKTGAENEIITFVQDVRFVYGYYLNNTITTDDALIDVVNSEIAGDVYYTVESGDTPISIAAKNNISYSELLSLNPSMTDIIYPGSQLLVSAKVPYLNVSVKRTEVYNESIAYQTITRTNDSYYAGYSYVSVSGKNGVNKVTADVTYVDGIETSRTVTSTSVIEEPVAKVVIQGTKAVVSYSGSQYYGTGSYVWPVGGSGGYVSCAFGGYYGHTGMDIATNVGTPIYAVDSGTVITVKSLTYSLGKYIMIDHGNGIVTVYGHNSVLYAKVGQYVNKGDVIALSGNTGKSTGPHLHIAFLVNGTYRNPAYYIGTR